MVYFLCVNACQAHGMTIFTLVYQKNCGSSTVNLLGKITKTQLLLLFMTLCFLSSLFFLYEKASDTAVGTDYTITVTQREPQPVTPEPPKAPALVDINAATLDELQTLTGIGPVLAQRIIDYRTENGAFTSIEDLLNVKGIGEATLNKFRDRVTISPPEDTGTEEESATTEENDE